MNKYLEKLATVVDMDGSFPKEQRDLASRANKAKPVNPEFKPSPKIKSGIPTTKFTGSKNKVLKRVAIGGAIAAKAGASIYAYNKVKDHLAKKEQEKTAAVLQPGMNTTPNIHKSHKTDIAETGTIAASGAVTGEVGHSIMKRIGEKGAKGVANAAKAVGKDSLKTRAGRMGIVGGLGVLGDYAAVKINKNLFGGQQKEAQIEIKKQNRGKLHQKLGIPQGKKIGNGKLNSVKNQAKHSGNVKLEREVVFAQNAKKWNHGK